MFLIKLRELISHSQIPYKLNANTIFRYQGIKNKAHIIEIQAEAFSKHKLRMTTCSSLAMLTPLANKPIYLKQ
jgi:hypothetical protein